MPEIEVFNLHVAQEFNQVYHFPQELSNLLTWPFYAFCSLIIHGGIFNVYNLEEID
jgi:hypothetical protein